MVVAVYPGTFDPLTRGHEDLVRRASSIFDTLVVGVADSRNKKPFFTPEERLDIAHEVLGHYPKHRVTAPRPAIMRRLLKRFGALGLLPQELGQHGLPIGRERPGALRESRGVGRQPQLLRLCRPGD